MYVAILCIDWWSFPLAFAYTGSIREKKSALHTLYPPPFFLRYVRTVSSLLFFYLRGGGGGKDCICLAWIDEVGWLVGWLVVMR